MAEKVQILGIQAKSDESPADLDSQDRRYEQAAAEFGAAIARLARGYEVRVEVRQELIQEIHLALWRSFANFDARCSLRTWVYQVAHNTALKHLARSRRLRFEDLQTLEEIEDLPSQSNTEVQSDRERASDRLLTLIDGLNALDREVILLYLEDLPAEDIAQLTSLSARNIATKIHRIKQLLAKLFSSGAKHD